MTIFYQYDSMGRMVEQRNPAGVVKAYVYDAFGNQRDPVKTDPNPFRYCGEYFDRETGEIYLRARYYNSRTGRFGSEDPAQDGLNRYAYCEGNPVAFVDPLGLKDRPYSVGYINQRLYGHVSGPKYQGQTPDMEALNDIYKRDPYVTFNREVQGAVGNAKSQSLNSFSYLVRFQGRFTSA